MSEEMNLASSRYRHYAVDLKRYYRMPAVQASLTGVLSLLIVAFFIMVAIRPTLTTIAELNKNIESSEKTLKQLQAKERAVIQMDQVWQGLFDEQVNTDAAVPQTGAEYDELTTAIEILAGQAGTKLAGVTVGESLLYSELVQPYEGRGRQVVTTPITIRVTGSYQAVRAFFAQLTQMDRLVDIDSTSISRETGVRSGSSNDVSMSIAGSVGYLADQEALRGILADKEKKE